MTKKEIDMQKYAERRLKQMNRREPVKDPYAVMFDKNRKGNQYAKLRGI